MSKHRRIILIVDEQQDRCELLKKALRSRGWLCMDVSTPEELLSALAGFKFDYAVVNSESNSRLDLIFRDWNATPMVDQVPLIDLSKAEYPDLEAICDAIELDLG